MTLSPTMPTDQRHPDPAGRDHAGRLPAAPGAELDGQLTRPAGHHLPGADLPERRVHQQHGDAAERWTDHGHAVRPAGRPCRTARTSGGSAARTLRGTRRCGPAPRRTTTPATGSSPRPGWTRRPTSARRRLDECRGRTFSWSARCRTRPPTSSSSRTTTGFPVTDPAVDDLDLHHQPHLHHPVHERPQRPRQPSPTTASVERQLRRRRQADAVPAAGGCSGTGGYAASTARRLRSTPAETGVTCSGDGADCSLAAPPRRSVRRPCRSTPAPAGRPDRADDWLPGSAGPGGRTSRCATTRRPSLEPRGRRQRLPVEVLDRHAGGSRPSTTPTSPSTTRSPPASPTSTTRPASPTTGESERSSTSRWHRPRTRPARDFRRRHFHKASVAAADRPRPAPRSTTGHDGLYVTTDNNQTLRHGGARQVTSNQLTFHWDDLLALHPAGRHPVQARRPATTGCSTPRPVTG